MSVTLNEKPARQPLLQEGNPDPFRLALATRPEDDRIDELRRTAYASAGNFSITDPALIARNSDPSDSLCLIIANRKTVAATVRMVFARQRSRAEAVLQGPAPLEDSLFPTMTLCRGATHPVYRGQGLMTFLVGIGVAVARQAGVSSTTGMQVQGTRHYHGMLKSGWMSRDVSSEDVKCIDFSESDMKLVYIDKTRYSYSEDYARQNFAQLRRALRSDEVIAQAGNIVRRMQN